MHKLFNIVNMGYATNSIEVKVTFKKKYIFVLEKLLKINCIQSYTFDKNFIFIKLRYFNNKPLFFFLLKSKSGNKVYKEFLEKSNIPSFYSLSLYFTNKGLLTSQETIFKKVGGEHVVDILFLSKK